ncbi:hypothetical protein DFQ28_004373, partial [Apophysomyces sp. BC1034]
MHWEQNWAAKRIHGSTRRQVEAMFQEEKPHLRPLPATGFRYFTEVVRTVWDDTTVSVDRSNYAARPAAIGSLVCVRIYDTTIEIRDRRTQLLLRLSGIHDTLQTRVLQAQGTQQPFLETFALILQDELDRRQSRLIERRYQQSCLEEKLTLVEFDWSFNPKLPRQACFQLHMLKSRRQHHEHHDSRPAYASLSSAR